MTDKQPSSEDILARIRGAGASKPAQSSESQPAENKPAESSPATASPAPAGTSGILASIRGGGAPAPAASGDAPAAAPKGTSSILDSIRGGGAPAARPAAPAGGSILDSIRGGGAASPAAKPAAAKTESPAKVDVKAAAGMSAADMIRAARQGVTAGPGDSPAEEKKVALPAKPLVKPVAVAKPVAAADGGDRRGFLSACFAVLVSPLVVAWTSLISATAASGLAVARFMMPNVLVEPPTKFKIGPPTDYGAGTVSTKWKAQFAIWIVNDEIDGQQMIYALSTVCTHLGCTPNWLEGEQKFKCPCHGSGFYKTGINFEGPAPRPLERYAIRLAEDGMLEVDKSSKFQRELGQWENAASFVPV
ncbi:MAG: ubiquinol-cytochrome c reductase iron-sulfur subunit [Planctomycetaceae bacterium]